MKRLVGLTSFALVVFLTFAIVERDHASTATAVQGTYGPNGNAGYLGTLSAGVKGTSSNGNEGFLGSGFAGVQGASSDPKGTGVLGKGYVGVLGTTSTVYGIGVSGSAGTTHDADGVYGSATGSVANGSIAVEGYSPQGYAIYGFSYPGRAGGGYAGYFDGDVSVNGTLLKSAGAFRIDHPLDPLNKYLQHSFVESDEMKNVYDGIATLDRHGESIVELPKWFGALNKDFRYQLTCIGEHAPVFIADEIHENHFRIAGGYEGMRVSWQVTGVRQDPYATAHTIIVEELKPIEQRGRLLHPDVYHQPESAGIDYDRITAAARKAAATSSALPVRR